MDKKIEAAIRETLVIGNPVSIKRCVDKLKLIFEQEQALRQANVMRPLAADADVLQLMKDIMPEPMPVRWTEDEDMNPNYMVGFLTAVRYMQQANGE